MAGLGHGPYGRGDYGVGLYGTDEIAEFPTGPLRTAVELFLDGQWVDITPLVYGRGKIQITRGRQDEASPVGASQCSMLVNNRDGALSPRNPQSPYYGLLGRNTPLRVSVRYGLSRMVHTSSAGATTPDSAQQDVTGDIDIRVDLTVRAAYEGQDLVYKYGAAGQRSYYFLIAGGGGGGLKFQWSADGTTVLTATSDVAAPWAATGRMALRVTLDVNNGAAGNTTTFYTADTIDGPWIELGEPVVKAGTTSIFSSTAAVVVAASTVDTAVYAAVVKSGIAGTTVASADFATADDDATSFLGGAGETWTFTGDAYPSNRRYRFLGELAELPVKFTPGGQDVWVELKAAGILRRLATRTDVLQSTLRRALPVTADIVAYWPAEDGAGSSFIASGIGGTPMSVSGSPEYATFSEFAASGPLPVLNNSKWTGRPPTYTSTDQAEVRFLYGSAGSVTTGAVICRVFMTGSAFRWDLVYTTAAGGSLNFQAYDRSGVLLGSTGATAEGIDGFDWYFALQISASGADVLGQYAIYQMGAGGYSSNSFFAVASTAGRCTDVVIDPNVNIDTAAAGHVSLASAITTPVFGTALFDQANAYAGRESAAQRIERLCDEEGVPVEILGFDTTSTADGSPLMGPQTTATLSDLLREAERTDQGLLYESLTEIGLVYRPRLALLNRRPTATLSYDTSDLDQLSPTDDDQATANDVTVSRTGGSSYTATQETGPLNVNDPTDDPQGVGRYPAQVTINNYDDGELRHHAGWRRRLGTVDEARYPEVGVNFGNPAMSPTSVTASDVLEVDVGHRITIAALPAWIPGDTLSLAVQGWRETLSNKEWVVAFNCTPESPWTVGVYGYDSARWAVTSTLGETLTAVTASFQVVTASGPVWSTTADDFDIGVAGERMTVTAVTGTASPQTFTVTRAVNGQVKAHLSGAAVALWEPAHYAI